MVFVPLTSRLVSELFGVELRQPCLRSLSWVINSEEYSAVGSAAICSITHMPNVELDDLDALQSE